MNNNKGSNDILHKSVKEFFIDSEPYCMMSAVSIIYKKSLVMNRSTFKLLYDKY